MKKLFIATCILLSIGLTSTYAQLPQQYAPKSKLIVADETYAIASGKDAFRIATSNAEIAKQLLLNLGGIMIRFTYAHKNDRFGEYWERSYYFTNACYDTVMRFINTINKPK